MVEGGDLTQILNTLRIKGHPDNRVTLDVVARLLKTLSNQCKSTQCMNFNQYLHVFVVNVYPALYPELEKNETNF